MTDYENTPLGKSSEVPSKPDRSVLCAIARKSYREKWAAAGLEVSGEDIWNCYELSWLDKFGVPQVAVCRITYSFDSPRIVESKSLKLFLGGFFNTSYENPHILSSEISTTLSEILGANVDVRMYLPQQWEFLQPRSGVDGSFDLDMLRKSEAQLAIESKEVSDYKFSGNCFRSLCPVTRQPDWARYQVNYRGIKLKPESLLGYLMTYREHAAFHEEVCEKIFTDLHELLRPQYLAVSFNFLRRGGIDINPRRYTSNYPFPITFRRNVRQ